MLICPLGIFGLFLVIFEVIYLIFGNQTRFFQNTEVGVHLVLTAKDHVACQITAADRYIL